MKITDPGDNFDPTDTKRLEIRAEDTPDYLEALKDFIRREVAEQLSEQASQQRRDLRAQRG